MTSCHAIENNLDYPAHVMMFVLPYHSCLSMTLMLCYHLGSDIAQEMTGFCAYINKSSDIMYQFCTNSFGLYHIHGLEVFFFLFAKRLCCSGEVYYNQSHLTQDLQSSDVTESSLSLELFSISNDLYKCIYQRGYPSMGHVAAAGAPPGGAEAITCASQGHFWPLR
jgi:hypothetical protein